MLEVLRQEPEQLAGSCQLAVGTVPAAVDALQEVQQGGQVPAVELSPVNCQLLLLARWSR